MTRAIGVPVLTPSKTPLKISTLSSSFRCVSNLLFPGFLLSSSLWINSSSILRPEGTPSTIHPIALPCDSPKVVKLKIFPKVLKLIFFILFKLLKCYLCYFLMSSFFTLSYSSCILFISYENRHFKLFFVVRSF